MLFYAFSSPNAFTSEREREYERICMYAKINIIIFYEKKKDV